MKGRGGKRKDAKVLHIHSSPVRVLNADGLCRAEGGA